MAEDKVTPKTDFPPVRACIFDMDGLLIDSEDIYTLVTNTVLSECGRPPLPWHIKAQLQGRSGPNAHTIFHQWAQLPISHDEYLARTATLQRQHFPTVQPLPGVPSLLRKLSSARTGPSPFWPGAPRDIELALATSSATANYELKTSHLPMFEKYFPRSRRVLGDDKRIKRGKPQPDIFLVALDAINGSGRGVQGRIQRQECLVFEDSVPGVEAARRAGMRVVWCPHPGLLEEVRGKEGEVLAGLCGEGGAEEGGVQEGEVVEGWPGRVGDGWAEQLRTLEDFDYAKYGIAVEKEEEEEEEAQRVEE